MKLKIAVFLAAVLIAAGARAQTITAVTGTILDPNAIPYGPGTVTVNISPPGVSSPTITATNSPLITPIAAQLNASGFFSLNLVANASITPGGTQYTFRFCVQNPIPPPFGTGTSCFTSAPITIAGSSQDISASVTPAALIIDTNPTRVYNTAPAAGNTSIGATTMTTAPAQPTPGSRYNFAYYLTQTAVGVGCTGNSTIVVNAIFQDPNAAAAQTVAGATYTVTTNGTVGNVPFTSGGAGNFSVLAKAGTVVQFSTTYTAGAGCTTAPAVQLYPTLELQ